MSKQTIFRLSGLAGICLISLGLSGLGLEVLRGWLAQWLLGAPNAPASSRQPWVELLLAVGVYAGLYLAALLTLFVLPRPMRTMRDVYLQRRKLEGRFLWIGVLGGVGLLLLGSLLTLSISTCFLPFLGLGLFGAAWLGLVALALAVGFSLCRRLAVPPPSPFLDLAVGVGVLYTVSYLPVLGALLLIGLVAWAFGVVLATRAGLGEIRPLAEIS